MVKILNQLSYRQNNICSQKRRQDMTGKIPKKKQKQKQKQTRDDRRDLFLDPHTFGTFHRPPCRPPLPYPGRIPRLTSLHTFFLSISTHHPRTTRKPDQNTKGMEMVGKTQLEIKQNTRTSFKQNRRYQAPISSQLIPFASGFVFASQFPSAPFATQRCYPFPYRSTRG